MRARDVVVLFIIASSFASVILNLVNFEINAHKNHTAIDKGGKGVCELQRIRQLTHPCGIECGCLTVKKKQQTHDQILLLNLVGSRTRQSKHIVNRFKQR